MKLSIVIIPPQPLKNEISKLLKSISKKYKSKHNNVNLPHITVKALFETDKKNLKNIFKKIDKICKKTNSFKTKICGWNYFIDNPSPNVNHPYVVYMKVSISSVLQKLHENFVSNFSNLTPEFVKKFEMENYLPHMTLAYSDLTENNFKKALIDLESFNPLYEFEVNKVFLLFKDGKMIRWKIQKDFKLGG